MVDKKVKDQSQQGAPDRKCPGETYAISIPICKARQRNKYPKCLLCPFREDSASRQVEADPRIDPKIVRSDSIRGRHPVEMNPYVARKVGLAIGQFLRAENPSASLTVVGHDLWPHAEELATATITGVADAGLDIVDLGLVSHDMLVFELGTGHYDGGVMISGTACLYDQISLMLLRGDATPVGLQNGLESISGIARRLQVGRTGMAGRIQRKDIYDAFKSYVAKFALHLQPLKCVVDASCGMASRILPLMAEELPLDMVTLNFADLDEEALVNYRPDEFPTADALHNVRNAVASSNAQFGVVFDQQLERAAFFDEQGNQLRPDHVGVLIARELLRRNAGGSVLYDQRASAVLREEVKIAGGRAIRSPADYLCLCLTMVHKEALFGVDCDGRFYFRDFFHSDSGLIAMLLLWSVLSAERRPLSEIIAPAMKYAHSGELKFGIKTPKKLAAVVDALKNAYSDGRMDDLDGLTIAYHDWWMNIRPDPESGILRVAIEGREAAQVDETRQKIAQLVELIGS